MPYTDTDLYVYQPIEGVPVIACNGMHYIIGDMSSATLTITKPASGNTWTASITIGGFTETCTCTKTESGNVTTLTNFVFTTTVNS